jgi:hypothetical protein
MASIEEIGQRVEQRLEALLDESARLLTAVIALGDDGARANRGLDAGRTTDAGIKIFGRDGPVRPSRGSVVTLAEPDAVDGNDLAQDAPVNPVGEPVPAPSKGLSLRKPPSVHSRGCELG